MWASASPRRTTRRVAPKSIDTGAFHLPMDSVNFRDLSVESFDTRTLLSHAKQQAEQRRYEDFLIVDVDAHHYETDSYAEICEYIEDPVMREQARYQGFGGQGIASASGSYQNLGGRVN